MILFKPESKQKILAGEKTQTRKLWAKPRAREGAEHLFYLRPPMTGEPPFARARIVKVWRQKLGEMSEAEARAEGYPTLDSFYRQFRKINDRKLKGDLRDVQVYAVEFRVTEKLA